MTVYGLLLACKQAVFGELARLRTYIRPLRVAYAEAGLTLAKGKVGSWLKNDKGVVIHLGANSEGVALQIGVEGLKVSF